MIPQPHMDRYTEQVRAGILAETLRYVSQITGEFTPFAVHEGVRRALGYCEEQCGGDIDAALFLLVRAGLLQCNRYNAAKQEIWWGADTRLRVMPAITAYIWREETSDVADDDAEGIEQ